MIRVKEKQDNCLKAYELWTWARNQEKILSLKNRLGFNDGLWILGFDINDDGCIFDPIHEKMVYNPANALKPNLIPFYYSAVPEMYFILSKYAESSEFNLSGKLVSASNLDILSRFKINEEESTHLLQYAERDFVDLKSRSNFFDSEHNFGDFSFSVLPLPKVHATLILWRGDDEVKNEGKLLFDSSITHCLSGLEVELAGLTVWRLRNILNPEVKWGYHELVLKKDR